MSQGEEYGPSCIHCEELLGDCGCEKVLAALAYVADNASVLRSRLSQDELAITSKLLVAENAALREKNERYRIAIEKIATREGWQYSSWIEAWETCREIAHDELKEPAND